MPENSYRSNDLTQGIPVTPLTPLPVTSSGTGVGGSQTVSGVDAPGSATTASPVPIGYQIQTTPQNAGADGQAARVQGDAFGAPYVSLKGAGSTATVAVATLVSDGVSTGRQSLAAQSFGYVFNGASWDRFPGGTTGAYSVQSASSSATVAIVPNATATASSALVAKASAGNLYGYNIVSGASAGYLMVFDATTAPADGTVAPKKCIPIAANTGLSQTFPVPIRFTTGIVLVFSTTGPFTKTASATAFIEADAV